MRSVFIVEVHGTVSCIKTCGFDRKCFYVEYVFSQQILMKVHGIKWGTP